MNRADDQVLVVGAGPAGLATAIELASAGVGVVVVEARAEPTERFGETLAPGVLAQFDRLGLADTLRVDGHLACPGTVVQWGSDRLGHNDFVLDPLGPAWHIDRTRLEAALRVRAEAAGAQVLTSTRLSGIDLAGDHACVLLRDPSGGRVVRAAWLVDASGPGARVARRLGARRVVVDRLVALIRIASLVDGMITAQTLVESTPLGWWYAARLPGQRLAIVLITEPKAVRQLTANGWAGWSLALGGTRLLAERLAEVRLGTEPGDQRMGVRSVVVSRLDRVAGARWLAVGDAAAELDPITGRGIHEALADASHAVRALLVGLPESASSYQARIEDRFQQHVAERSTHYDLERRWPGAPFWRARSDRALAQ